ncbi:hypothetical protein AVEN_128208-1 [Araneus ventricosus]|uniref:Uncharacterized protein n=1 Tax=Araneus ventricosus TaxID=182803 RepID=A0A4Y2A173_ARAVE|nr:hypothetical protein AVEN_128208-1 [Araneus ventricosus]
MPRCYFMYVVGEGNTRAPLRSCHETYSNRHILHHELFACLQGELLASADISPDPISIGGHIARPICPPFISSCADSSSFVYQTAKSLVRIFQQVLLKHQQRLKAFEIARPALLW